jgi:hypothetical protein
MTNRELTAMHLEELISSAKPAYFEQRYLDAIEDAISELSGDNPFEDDKEFYKTDCGGECDKTYEIQGDFESVIQNAIEVLEEVQGKTKEDCTKIRDVIRDLNLAI